MTPARILLVDDEPALLRAHERILRKGGYDVTTANDGAQAAALLEGGKFDALVSDITMPTLDGIGLLRAVRARDGDLPVVLMTGNPAVDTAIAGIEFGVLRYLIKPVSSEELLSVVKRAVAIHGWARIRRAAERELGTVPLTPPHALGPALDRALDGLWMAYQPIVRWSERKVLAHEALMRSREPTLPYPDKVLRAAEDLDRCDDVGRRVRSCVAAMLKEAANDTRIFVNLHSRDLMDASLYEPDAPLSPFADRIVLEITERASLHDVAALPSRLADLRRMGFRIAVDDLGAGYAGLTSFAQLEPDVVKIDMSLIRDVHKQPVKQRLIRAVSMLGQDLGLMVVAEGVETAEERDTLLELGCDLLQGYLFAKPGPPFPTVKW